jgi:hypothetical protein
MATVGVSGDLNVVQLGQFEIRRGTAIFSIQSQSAPRQFVAESSMWVSSSDRQERNVARESVHYDRSK